MCVCACVPGSLLRNARKIEPIHLRRNEEGKVPKSRRAEEKVSLVEGKVSLVSFLSFHSRQHSGELLCAEVHSLLTVCLRRWGSRSCDFNGAKLAAVDLVNLEVAWKVGVPETQLAHFQFSHTGRRIERPASPRLASHQLPRARISLVTENRFQKIHECQREAGAATLCLFHIQTATFSFVSHALCRFRVYKSISSLLFSLTVGLHLGFGSNVNFTLYFLQQDLDAHCSAVKQRLISQREAEERI